MNRRHPYRPWLFFGAPVLLIALAAAGCADRTYLTKSHGRAYSEAFSRQTVNPNPSPRPGHADATQGLDSQEAAAVAKSYRRSLAGKEGASDATTQPMVIMNPGAAPSSSYMPPPSVPGGQ